MPQQEHRHEYHHTDDVCPRQGAHGVHHLGDNAGGKAQGHDAGVRKQVGEIPGDVVQAEDAVGQLHDGVLLVPALGEDQAHRPGDGKPFADGGHDGAADDHLAARKDDQAHQHKVPEAHVKQGVDGVAPADHQIRLEPKAHQDVDVTHHKGHDKDGHGVGEGVQQHGHLYPVAEEHLGDLGDGVTEPAAVEGAPKNGGDAAVAQHLQEFFAPGAHVQVLCPPQPQDGQHQAVAGVGEHHPEEHEEEGGHKGVGVQAVGSRKGVHLGDGLKGLHKFVIP